MQPAFKPAEDPQAVRIVRHRRAVLLAAFVIAAAVFAADILSSLQGALAVLYITAILLVAQVASRAAVIAAGAGCFFLATLAFAAWHLDGPVDSAYARYGVSVLAIVITTLLSMRDRSARTTLAEQARILELTHDTVIIRDARDLIVYWNEGAEDLYGWTRAEALGRNCDELLQSALPVDEVARSIGTEGQWSGEISRTRRDGKRLVLASRWLERRNPEGRPVGVIETSADLTEQRHADEQRSVSERRYSTMFHAAGFATWESDWSKVRARLMEAIAGAGDVRAWLTEHPKAARGFTSLAVIRDANRAAADLFGLASRDDLIGGNIVGRFTLEEEMAILDLLAGLAEGADMVEAETRFRTLQGKRIDVVVRITVLDEGEPWSRVLVMAYNMTERNEARARLEQASAELAHAARVATLGQLAASIAHEVNQPLAAIINYGKSGLRWLKREEPDLGEAANCLDHIVSNGSRASAVIGRVRALARKSAPEAEPLDLAELIDEAMELVQREARNADVTMRRGGVDVPNPIGDRVQVQQVVVNLLINAIHAMSGIKGRPRDLRVLVEPDGDGMVRVAVEDSGKGFDADALERVFEPFFTTKEDGMGMGLSICRSIIRTQGGDIQAANNGKHGATVAFTLPVQAPEPPV